MKLRINIKTDNVRFALLAFYTFTLPNSVAVNNIAGILLLLYWIIFYKGKKDFFKIVIDNPVVFFSYLLFFSFILSLLWSSDLKWGLHIIKKEMFLLYMPIFMQLIKKEEIHTLIKIFIISMTVSELISYSVHFGIIKPVFHATPYDPSPFMGHISYNPFLAFTIYLLIYYFMTTKESFIIKLLSVFFITSMSINLFITGGRAGQVAFFVILFIVFMQFFKITVYKGIVFIIIMAGIFTFAYKNSNIFNHRVNLAVRNIKHYKTYRNSSMGLRITFWENTLKMVKHNPLFGVGVGDYPKEYAEINKKFTPVARPTVQPHNMYLFVWASNGIFSFLSLILIFFSEIVLGFRSRDELKNIRIAFPIFFMVIMFSDSYLLGHYTSNLFIFFSVILYQGFTWKNLKKY